MNLLITGASGFVGSHLARAAHQRGDRVRCLVRPSSDLALLDDTAVQTVVGDLTDKDSLRQAVTDLDAVVHCAAVTSEAASDPSAGHRTNVLGTKNLVELCGDNDVRRFVFVSTLSAIPQNTGVYGRTKLEAERIVAASSLRFTVLRPSTVYGPGARGLSAKIERYVATLPLIPVIGDGRQRFRPIYVGDVVSAILACLGSENAVRKTYDLGGLDGISFAQFIDGMGDVCGKRRPQIRLPVSICMGLARAFALAAKNPPLTVDNILGITQMSECDISRAQEDFGFQPMSFRDGIGLMQRNNGKL